MKEDTDNSVTRTLVDCLATAGEDIVRHALEQAGVDPQAAATSVDPTRIAQIITPLLVERLDITLAQALPSLATRADWALPLHSLSTRAVNIVPETRDS